MAIVYPLANGNWSTVANWYSGGVAYGSLPLSGDTVYANGKVVTIDVATVTVVSLNNAASAPAIAGGYFQCSINCTITATLNQKTDNTAGAVLNTIPTSGVTINLIGNVNAGAASFSNACLSNSGLGTLNITGNIFATVLSIYSSMALYNSGICNITGNVNPNGFGNNGGGAAYLVANYGTLTVNGTVTGGFSLYCGIYNNSNSAILNINGAINANTTNNSGNPIINPLNGTVNVTTTQTVIGSAGCYAINNASLGIININANILGSVSATPSTAYYLINSSAGVVNINGNVTMQSVSPSGGQVIITNNSTGTINVTGNISGGTVANTCPIGNFSTGTINVTGNVTGGSNATNTPALYTTTAGTFNINGTTTSGLYPAIFSTVTTAKFNLLGNIVNTAGLVAYYGSLIVKCSPTVGQSITYRSTSGTDRILATTNVSNGAPVIANVRDGVIYGSTNELTGTLEMALPVDVRVNVPTDNTVGTATITAQDFWDYAVSNLNTVNSIGRRLKNVSTADITGDQLTALSS